MKNQHNETKRKKEKESLRQAYNKLEKHLRERTAEVEKINTQLMRETETPRQKEKWFKSVLDAAHHVSFIITDLNGTEARIMEFSRGAENIFGYSRKEIIGKPVAKLHLPEDVARFPVVIEAMRQQKIGFIGELILVRKSGEKFKAIFNTAPLFDTKGQMVAAIGVSIDISDRVEAEKALLESEAKYRSLFDNALVGLFRTRVSDGKLIKVNQRYAELAGYSTIEECLEDFNTSENYVDPNVCKQLIKDLNEQGKIKDYEAEIKRKDGTKFWVSFSAQFHQKSGYLEGVLIDITEKKRAEEKLLEHKAELEIGSRHQEEVNSALKVLLKQMDADKKEFQESVVANVKELVDPFIDKLSKSALDNRQKAFLGIIQSNLNDIISPFIGSVSSKYLKLTPMEIQVASLIKHGKTTKDIAGLLNLSIETIKSHRKNVRNKIGIKNKKVNLRTQLLSFR